MICEFSENFLAFRFPLLAPPLQASTLTAILFFFFLQRNENMGAKIGYFGTYSQRDQIKSENSYSSFPERRS